jgi:ABC-type transport system involved in cytochrome bd biosynthesis fused ATPase/permease subunit
LRQDLLLLRLLILGPLLLWPTQGSIVIRIHVTTGVSLISICAAMRIALQLLILLTLIKNTVVRASIELSKFHRHWPDQLLRPIGIAGTLLSFGYVSARTLKSSLKLVSG